MVPKPPSADCAGVLPSGKGWILPVAIAIAGAGAAAYFLWVKK